MNWNNPLLPPFNDLRAFNGYFKGTEKSIQDFLATEGWKCYDCSFKWLDNGIQGHFAAKFLPKFLKIFQEFFCEVDASPHFEGWWEVKVNLTKK